MAHPIGEVPHAGLEPDLFERFHQEMVTIKNNRKYTYTQRLYDKGYSKSEMQFPLPLPTSTKKLKQAFLTTHLNSTKVILK